MACVRSGPRSFAVLQVGRQGKVREKIEDVPAQLRAACAVFRRAPSEDDALPADLLELVESRDAPFGLNPALPRRVRASGSARHVHLVPGNGLLAQHGAGGDSVVSTEQALSGENGGTAFRGTGRLEVFALMPDGVTNVSIVRRDGRVIPVAIDDHAFAVTVEATSPTELPYEVVYVLDGARRSWRVPGADDEGSACAPQPGS